MGEVWHSSLCKLVRTKCSIEGIDVYGQPINGEYITSNTQEIMQKRVIKQLSFDIPVGRQGINVKKQIVALINDKNMPQNSVTDDCPYIVKEDASTAILFDINSFDDFFDEIHEDIETIYIVSTNNKAFKAAKRELDELPERTKTIPVTFPMSDGFERSMPHSINLHFWTKRLFHQVRNLTSCYLYYG